MPTAFVHVPYRLHYLSAFGHYQFPKNLRPITARQEFADVADGEGGKEPPHGTILVLDSNQTVVPALIEAWSTIVNHAHMQKNLVIFDAGLGAMRNSLRKIRTYMEYRMSVNTLHGVHDTPPQRSRLTSMAGGNDFGTTG